MKDGAIRILGLILIILGILGFLLLGNSIIGFSISNIGNNNLEFSEIEDMILKNGDHKIIDINAKNTGKKDLTNCNLTITGKKSAWLKGEETKNIPAKSNTNFNLEINIPIETPIEDYPIALQLTCDQSSTLLHTSISVTKGIEAIKIIKISSEKNILNLNYSFDNQGFIGKSTYVEIWVKNPDGFEINRIIDKFSINNDNLIIRNVRINLNEKPNGVYNVFISHPSDLENYIKKSVILGNSRTSGNAIFKIVKGKGFPYAIFLLIIAIGIFFIFKSHRRAVQNVNQQISKTPKLRRLK